MVDLLAFLLLSFASIREGCPCHTSSDDIDLSRRDHDLREHRNAQCDNCPMKGNWGPWMAAGGAIKLVGRLLEVGGQTLLFELAVLGLDDRERGIVLRDFDAARRHIWLTVAIKLSFWRQFPWCLFGIAHRCEEEARHSARRSLRMFAALAAGTRIDVITALMLHPDNPCREQVVAFATAGVAMNALPLLLRLAARMFFV